MSNKENELWEEQQKELKEEREIMKKTIEGKSYATSDPTIRQIVIGGNKTMKTKEKQGHTPGPWSIDKPFSESGLYIQAQDTSLVCLLLPKEMTYTTEKELLKEVNKKVKANACLIAASPELLDCLKKAEAHLRFLALTMPENLAAKQVCNEVADQSFKVISKAEGRS